MQLVNEVKRVQITALDRKCGKSKTMTVYDATPEEAIEMVRQAVSERSRRAIDKSRARRPAKATAGT